MLVSILSLEIGGGAMICRGGGGGGDPLWVLSK